MRAAILRMPLLPLLLGASACAVEPPAQGDDGGRTVSVVVGFSTAFPGDAPNALASLTRAGGAEVRFVSSLSERSHRYQLRCPATDPGCRRVLDSLRHQPGIDYADTDKPKDFR